MDHHRPVFARLWRAPARRLAKETKKTKNKAGLEPELGYTDLPRRTPFCKVSCQSESRLRPGRRDGWNALPLSPLGTERVSNGEFATILVNDVLADFKVDGELPPVYTGAQWRAHATRDLGHKWDRVHKGPNCRLIRG